MEEDSWSRGTDGRRFVEPVWVGEDGWSRCGWEKMVEVGVGGEKMGGVGTGGRRFVEPVQVGESVRVGGDGCSRCGERFVESVQMGEDSESRYGWKKIRGAGTGGRRFEESVQVGEDSRSQWRWEILGVTRRGGIGWDVSTTDINLVRK